MQTIQICSRVDPRSDTPARFQKALLRNPVVYCVVANLHMPFYPHILNYNHYRLSGDMFAGNEVRNPQEYAMDGLRGMYGDIDPADYVIEWARTIPQILDATATLWKKWLAQTDFTWKDMGDSFAENYAYDWETVSIRKGKLRRIIPVVCKEA